MAGLLNSSLSASPAPAGQPSGGRFQVRPRGAGPAAPGGLSDPMLQKIVSGIEAKLSPRVRQLYLSCVHAGMAALFGAQTGGRVQAKLKSSTNPEADIAAGIANIFATIYNEVVAKVPQAGRGQFLEAFLPALLAASATLACHAIDTAEQLGKIKLTPGVAAQAMHDAALACLQKLGIGPAQIRQATAHGRQGQGRLAAEAALA